MSLRALMVRALNLKRNKANEVRLRFKFEPIDVTVLSADEDHLIVQLPIDAVVSFQLAESE